MTYKKIFQRSVTVSKKINNLKNNSYSIFDKYYFLHKNVIELNNYKELQKVFGWEDDPVLDRPDIYDFDYIEDVNERRIRDAESLAVVMRNVKPKIALEIGTAGGQGTALMAINAPECIVHTVNIPPEEIVSGKGGKHTTIALEIDKIGNYYKEKGIKNINQIFANTATWTPDIGRIDVAFVDGCHDKQFVVNDTKKILRSMFQGSFILWHDFNPSLVDKFNWIEDVCLGVESLYRRNLLTGKIFHIKDSWIGIYKV
ncbi:MAG: class I SAM-dependent methyltransferase [Bacteroidota bacterium]|nr:class I SAM-dependent methyltransferase [Bacteroidota bacterium]